MIVSNTTPLIAFARIEELDLLQKIVGYILIPDAVRREITEARAKHQGLIATVRPFLERMQVQGIRYSRRFVEGFLKESGE